MKGLIITAAITLLILVGGVFLLSKGSTAPKAPKQIDQSILVKANSHQTNPAAKVTVVEFGDYRCPACKASYPGTKELLKNYGDKINFVFRNYAFLPDSNTNQNPNASTLAANAAECANDQGKFWEMHDWFYENQPDESDIKMFTGDNLASKAKSLGMDENKFKACLNAKTHDDVVKADFADGQLAGVAGTPAFFINGTLLPGVPMYEDLKAAVDAILNTK